MEQLRNRIIGLAIQGLCCSQIILSIGLERYGVTDNAAVKGAFGLCGGLHAGLACGTLTGAAVLVSTICGKTDTLRITRELAGWFTERFGSTGCSEILERNPGLQDERCLSLVEEALTRVLELIDEARIS